MFERFKSLPQLWRTGRLSLRLLRDPRVPRWRKIFLALVLVYLVIPIDLVPDFIPVAGQLDDAVLVWLALRGLWQTGLVREHWPGPDLSRI